ncbi:MAG TPA: hypothetical protein PK359_00890 [Burkholderiaceae bacterium]|jgi:hypothetical protein|nr:hypothetical protein [Burkholderiaceae bacterium]
MNPSVETSFQTVMRRFGVHADYRPLRDDDVFLRSHMGRLEAADRYSSLPRRLRVLLMLVDGKASVADMRRGLARYRGLDDALDMLRQMGLIETLPIPMGR